MSLETGTYISDLVATNPVNASDPMSQGDDHLRLIKSTLLTTFPNITGAVTATHTELNVLKTDNDNAGMLADIAGIADPNADAILGWDDSAGAAIGFSLGGALSTSGSTLSVTAADILTQIKTVDGASSGLDADLLDGSQGSAYAKLASNNVLTGGELRIANSTGLFSGYNTANDTRSGYLEFAAAGTSYLNVEVNQALQIRTHNLDALYIGADQTVLLGGSSGNEAGFRGLPQLSKTSDYTLVAADAGKHVYVPSGTVTVSVPTHASVAYDVGTVITVVNLSSTSVSIGSSDTIRLAGSGASGTRTLAQYGIATLIKIATSGTVWIISGAGLS